MGGLAFIYAMDRDIASHSFPCRVFSKRLFQPELAAFSVQDP
jgi:hypothetical protein